MSNKASLGGWIEIDPMGKPRLTKRDSWKNKDGTFKRKCVQDWYAFKDNVRKEIMDKHPQFANYEFTNLYVTFFIQMPKSWSKKKKAEMNGKPHDQRPDIDNLVKAFMDSLIKTEDKEPMLDDAKIAVLSTVKLWTDKPGAISYAFSGGGVKIPYGKLSGV